MGLKVVFDTMSKFVPVFEYQLVHAIHVAAIRKLWVQLLAQLMVIFAQLHFFFGAAGQVLDELAPMVIQLLFGGVSSFLDARSPHSTRIW